MILAISRFRIANEMQHEVEEAFVNRPHLVDTVPGFIGLEVFTNRADSSAVYLITRWTDVNSFHSWHYSPAHRISHQGIPKGLKLDPSQTELLFLQRIAEESASIGGTVLDWPEMLSHFIAGSQLVCYFVADRAGIIQVCSAGFASALQMAREEVTGASLFSFMTEHSRTAIMVLIESRAREPRSTTMLNFRSRSGRYFTLECQLDVQPAAFAVIGSVSKEVQTQPYMETLEDLNNRLAVEIRLKLYQEPLAPDILADVIAAWRSERLRRDRAPSPEPLTRHRACLSAVCARADRRRRACRVGPTCRPRGGNIRRCDPRLDGAHHRPIGE